ncbi:unnamed protein product [Urochloa decumbens]|uniref:Prolamin-like domain-containing protein n=1 Tax=Urochloa decumbens TaxID=240449 RepID=A0ABC9C1I9_9POAL
MANGLSHCCRGVLLVLAVAHAVAATAPDAPAEAPARSRQLLPREYIPAPPTAEAGAVVPTAAAAAACVQSILEASRPCAADVLQTLVFKTVHLSKDCCRVLAGVGEECVAAVFSVGGGDVGPALLPVVNSVCGLVASIG